MRIIIKRLLMNIRRSPQELRAKLLEESHSSSTIPEKITIPELEQKIIQVSSQLMEQARLQQQRAR